MRGYYLWPTPLVLLVLFGYALYRTTARDVPFLRRYHRCTMAVKGEMMSPDGELRSRYGSYFTFGFRYTVGEKTLFSVTDYVFPYSRFRAGQEADILLNPDDPDEAVLKVEKACAVRSLVVSWGIPVLMLVLLILL